MTHASYAYESPNPALKDRVSWSAIFAGVVAGMVAQAILTLLGLAIGFNIFDPGQNSYMGLGIGSGLWLLCSALISGFIGGRVASVLANARLRFDGAIHGLLSWGVFMVVAGYLFGSGLGAIVGGTFNLTSAAMTGASQEVAESVNSPSQGVAAVREQVGAMTENRRVSPQAQERAADTAAGASWATFFLALFSLAASMLGGLSAIKWPMKPATV